MEDIRWEGQNFSEVVAPQEDEVEEEEEEKEEEGEAVTLEDEDQLLLNLSPRDVASCSRGT